MKTTTVDEELIGKVMACILNVAAPSRVILFGSAASGAVMPDSDLDLLVITRGSEKEREENLHLRSALSGIGIPVDVFTITPERFEETKGIIGGLAYPANKYGRIIYETS